MVPESKDISFLRLPCVELAASYQYPSPSIFHPCGFGRCSSIPPSQMDVQRPQSASHGSPVDDGDTVDEARPWRHVRTPMRSCGLACLFFDQKHRSRLTLPNNQIGVCVLAILTAIVVAALYTSSYPSTVAENTFLTKRAPPETSTIRTNRRRFR